MHRRRLNFNIALALLVGATLFLSMSARAVAAPSQQDVFKSIQDSMGSEKEVDSTPIYLLVAGGLMAMGTLALFSHRQKKGESKDAFNHPGKLMKEVLREVPLKSAELKQLKLLAGAAKARTGEDLTPLTLLLCPSLMAKGLKEDRGRVDRKTVAQMVRRLKLVATNGKS